MNERNTTDNEGYWNHENLVHCYTDYLKNVKSHLDNSKLPDYFNPMNNLLGKKDRGVLHRLADEVHRRRDELLHVCGEK